MDIIKFVVKGQHLHLKTDLKRWRVTSDTLNYFKCHFEFSSEWAGYDVRIYFKNASFNITKVVVPDSSGYCYIPWEVLAHTGAILCTVTGIKYEEGESLRLTTQPVNMFVHNSNEGSIGASDYVNPTPTEYEQFINQVRQHALDAISAKTAAIEAQIAAELAEYKIENMTVSTSELSKGSPVTVTKTEYDDHFNLEFGFPQSGGASAFVAEYGITSYSDVKTSYDNDEILMCTVDDSGNTMILQFSYFDDVNDTFYFAVLNGDGVYYTTLSSSGVWDEGTVNFASTSTATTLADGLMSYSDKSKLDGIASGAEVNVQSDWNQSTSTADDFIKNKPNVDEVIYAIRGSSDYGYNVIQNAVNNNKRIVVIDGSTKVQIIAAVPYTGSDYNSYKLYGFDDTHHYCLYIVRDDMNVWSRTSGTLAKIASPEFTGTPTAPTATAGTDTTQIATTAFVNASIVQSDWNQTTTTAKDYIKNKPMIQKPITISGSIPTSSDGVDGDIWLVYYPFLTLDNGSTIYHYQFEAGSTWNAYINSTLSNNKFSIDTNTNEVLWVATGTRIYRNIDDPAYVLKSYSIYEDVTYYVEDVSSGSGSGSGSGPIGA